MEKRSREKRNKRRALERRIEIPTGQDEDEPNGRKRQRIILTAYTPQLILRLKLKRKRHEEVLIDTEAYHRTPPSLRRPNPEGTSPGESFVDRLVASYNFI